MSSKTVHTLDRVVIRFAGDSGDGMQLTGDRFTSDTAAMGNDLSTLPNFPAEIRAPQGTTFGVSAFQINFGSTAIDTAGDQPDVLVAMNPAALKTNLKDLPKGGTLIVNTDAFTRGNLKKAGYAVNQLHGRVGAGACVAAFQPDGLSWMNWRMRRCVSGSGCHSPAPTKHCPGCTCR